MIEAASRGLTNREIADVLSYSPRTVEGLVAEARAWLDARNRPHLVACAIAGGYVAPRTTDLVARLSPRQRELAEAVARGETVISAACALGLAPATVAAHLRLARRATGSPNAAALAALIASDGVRTGAVALPRDARRGYRLLLVLLCDGKVEEAIARLRIALGDSPVPSS